MWHLIPDDELAERLMFGYSLTIIEEGAELTAEDFSDVLSCLLEPLAMVVSEHHKDLTGEAIERYSASSAEDILRGRGVVTYPGKGNVI